MRQLLRRIPVRLGFVGLFSKVDYDVITTPVDEHDPKPKGLAAVQRIFERDKYGEISEQLATMTNVFVSSTILGVTMGAFSSGRVAYINFMENNQASLFANHLEAKRALRDTMILKMGKGAAKWGLRIGGFTTCFASANFILAAYTGNTGVLEYVGAGAVTGALFKLNLGIKGMIAGSTVGSIIGLLGGLFSLLVLRLSGFSMQDVQKAQKELIVMRNKNINEKLRLLCNDEIEELKTRPHNKSDGSELEKIPTLQE